MKQSQKAKSRNRIQTLVKHLYVDEVQSIGEIMKATNLTRGMVYYYLLKIGVTPRKRDEWEKAMRVRNLKKKGGE